MPGLSPNGSLMVATRESKHGRPTPAGLYAPFSSHFLLCCLGTSGSPTQSDRRNSPSPPDDSGPDQMSHRKLSHPSSIRQSQDQACGGGALGCLATAGKQLFALDEFSLKNLPQERPLKRSERPISARTQAAFTSEWVLGGGEGASSCLFPRQPEEPRTDIPSRHPVSGQKLQEWRALPGICLLL